MKKLLSLLLIICVLLPLLPASAEDGAYLLGDADCDGTVSSADASIILRHLVRLSELSEQGRLNADVNEDGSVSAADSSAILRYIVRLDSLPPSGQVIVHPSVPKIEFESASLTLALGSSVLLSYTYEMEELPAIAWTSSDSGIVSVDSNGLVTGLSVGTAVISARPEGGVSSSVSVTVEEALPQISFINASFPESGAQYQLGTGFAPEGTIVSDSPILAISCQIYDFESRQSVASSYVGYQSEQNVRVYRIEGDGSLISALKLKTLSSGPKRLILSCTSAEGTLELYRCSFTVVDGVSTLRPVETASVSNENGRFVLYSSDAGWEEAQAWTRLNGGSLAIVATRTENGIVSNLASNAKLDCYLGASKGAGGWSWVQNEPFIYTNWAAGYDESSVLPGYLTLIGSGEQSGKWTAATASEKLGAFIAEYPLITLKVVQNKQQYELNEKFNAASDISVYAVYADGTETPVSNYSLSDTVLNSEGRKVIAVRYGSVQAVFTALVGTDAVLEGIWFEQCEHLPLPQDNETLYYETPFNLHGTVHSTEPLSKVILTIEHESSSSSRYPYVTTASFSAADELYAYDLNTALASEELSFNNTVKFQNLETGNHSYRLEAVVFGSTERVLLASGTFRIVRAGSTRQLTWRNFGHNYEQVLEFFDGDTSQFLFTYSFGEGRYINISSEWKRKYLTTTPGYNGRTWEVHKKSVSYYEEALNYLNTVYLRVHGTNGDSGVIKLGTLVNEQSGPQVSRYQTGNKIISHHAFGTAIDINPSMKPNENALSNQSLIKFEVGSCLTYNGILFDGTRYYYDFTYSGAYTSRLKRVPESIINYLIYELAFFRAGFRWGCYFDHTSDAMHYTLMESSMESHEPEYGGLRKVYSYIEGE
ncbi:MAG: dockerin type I domain-containing protein [Clostridia bacterium]|nr:dockerin type I domain-containing protein [Clostridia bacterium]